MSKGQFAPLTASLLARKGQATPAAAVIPVEGVPSMRKPAAAIQRTDKAPKTSTASPTKTHFRSTTNTQKNTKVTKLRPSNGAASKTKNNIELSKCLPSDSDTSCQTNGLMPRRTDKFGRVAVTLRLDPAHYLCLKLASAETRRTIQDILTEALTKHLRSMSKQDLKDCTCMRKLIDGQMTIGSS